MWYMSRRNSRSLDFRKTMQINYYIQAHKYGNLLLSINQIFKRPHASDQSRGFYLCLIYLKKIVNLEIVQFNDLAAQKDTLCAITVDAKCKLNQDM